MTIEWLYLCMVYLFCGVPFGLVLTTILGGMRDVREEGSGNIGTTNVARVYGWRVASLVLAADAMKGALAIGYGHLLRPASVDWDLLVTMAAFLGHCFPIYLRFRGGKGVATGAGAMAVLVPGAVWKAALAWAFVLAVTRRSSLASLLGAITLVGFVLVTSPQHLVIALALAIAIVLTHQANIGRLVRGTESPVMAGVVHGAPARLADPRELLHAPLAGDPAGTAP